MRKVFPLVVVGFVLGALISRIAVSADGASTPPAADPTGPKLENLLRAELEHAEGIEVIVSRVWIPPHTSLPKHWHPGEEFAYVLDGEVTLWQEGKEDLVGHAGDAMKVPLRQVHTAITGDSGATIVVFRVHEAGQPERFPAE